MYNNYGPSKTVLAWGITWYPTRNRIWYETRECFELLREVIFRAVKGRKPHRKFSGFTHCSYERWSVLLNLLYFLGCCYNWWKWLNFFQYCLSGHPTLPCNVLKFKSTTIMLDCGLDMTSTLNFLPLPLVQRYVLMHLRQNKL